MHRIYLILICCGLPLFAQAPKGEVAPKAPSMETQKDYFKAMAIYQGINAEIQEAQKKLALDQPALEEQRKKVTAALDAASASCGTGSTLDQQKLTQGDMLCVPKPPDPKTPKGDK